MELPIEYYEESVLRDIGKAIGPVLRVDTYTTLEAKGRFARLCVQVNLDKPIVKAIKVGGIRQPVQYEGISSLCFFCGRVGQKSKGCPYRAQWPVQVHEDAGKENQTSQNMTTEQVNTLSPPTGSVYSDLDTNMKSHSPFADRVLEAVRFEIDNSTLKSDLTKLKSRVTRNKIIGRSQKSRPSQAEQTGQRTSRLNFSSEWKKVSSKPSEITPPLVNEKKKPGGFSSDMVFVGFKAGGSCSEIQTLEGLVPKAVIDEQEVMEP